MYKLTFVLFIHISLILSIFAQTKCKSSDPVINTKSGKIRGVCKNIQQSGNIYSWLGVPYAKPPIGENRFKPPQPIDSWPSTLDTTAMPSFCMNFANKSSTTSSEFLNSFLKNSAIQLSEDCLYMNVFMSEAVYENFTHSIPAVPILVYFQHGNQNFFNPSNLVLKNDVIFVTVNYRIDVFGFLHLKDDSEKEHIEGNQGLLDQNLALEWIKNNAANFGGDAGRITIFGSYMGAKIASYHLLYKPSWPLFRNMILNSGGPINLAQNTISGNLASSRAKAFLKDTLKCREGSLIRCARRVDAFNLTMASRSFLFSKMSLGNKLTSGFLQSAFGNYKNSDSFGFI
jgi:carboxylesterase type B